VFLEFCYGLDMATSGIPQTIDELRSTLAGRIGLSPDEVAEDSSLFELGFDSVTAFALIGSWRRAGLSCPAQEFVDAPTLGDWWRLIQRAA
jgi:aryl carrier-like protein